MSKSLAIVASLASVFPLEVGAAGQINGAVTVLQAYPGMYLVTVSGTPSGTPACASANANRWTFNPSLADDRAKIATLQLAFALGKTVTVSGSGSCTITSAVEDGALVSVTN